MREVLAKALPTASVPELPRARHSIEESTLREQQSALNNFLKGILADARLKFSDQFIEFLMEDAVDDTTELEPRETAVGILLQVVDEQKATVGASKKLEIIYAAIEADIVIVWEFRTKKADIGFAVLFEGEEVRAFQRFNSHERLIQGSFRTPSMGKVMLRWDNSYSRLTSKKVYYKWDAKSALEAEAAGQAEAQARGRLRLRRDLKERLRPTTVASHTVRDFDLVQEAREAQNRAETEASGLKQEKREMQKNIQLLSERVVELEAARDAAIAAAESKATEARQAREEAIEAREKLDADAAERRSFEISKGSLEKRVKELEAQLNEEKMRCDMLSKKLAEADSTISAVEAERKKVQAQYDSIADASSVEELQTKLATARSSEKDAKKVQSKLASIVKRRTAEAEALENELTLKDSEMRRLRSEHESMQAAVATKDAELTAAAEAKATLDKQKKLLEKALKKLKKRVTQLEKEAASGPHTVDTPSPTLSAVGSVGESRTGPRKASADSMGSGSVGGRSAGQPVASSPRHGPVTSSGATAATPPPHPTPHWSGGDGSGGLRGGIRASGSDGVPRSVSETGLRFDPAKGGGAAPANSVVGGMFRRGSRSSSTASSGAGSSATAPPHGTRQLTLNEADVREAASMGPFDELHPQVGRRPVLSRQPPLAEHSFVEFEPRARRVPVETGGGIADVVSNLGNFFGAASVRPAEPKKVETKLAFDAVQVWSKPIPQQQRKINKKRKEVKLLGLSGKAVLVPLLVSDAVPEPPAMPDGASPGRPHGDSTSSGASSGRGAGHDATTGSSPQDSWRRASAMGNYLASAAKRATTTITDSVADPSERASKASGLPQFNVWCSNCGVGPLRRNHFACSVCHDFSLCCDCYSAGVHGYEEIGKAARARLSSADVIESGDSEASDDDAVGGSGSGPTTGAKPAPLQDLLGIEAVDSTSGHGGAEVKVKGTTDPARSHSGGSDATRQSVATAERESEGPDATPAVAQRPVPRAVRPQGSVGTSDRHSATHSASSKRDDGDHSVAAAAASAPALGSGAASSGKRAAAGGATPPAPPAASGKSGTRRGGTAGTARETAGASPKPLLDLGAASAKQGPGAPHLGPGLMREDSHATALAAAIRSARTEAGVSPTLGPRTSEDTEDSVEDIIASFDDDDNDVS